MLFKSCRLLFGSNEATLFRSVYVASTRRNSWALERLPEPGCSRRAHNGGQGGNMRVFRMRSSIDINRGLFPRLITAGLFCALFTQCGGGSGGGGGGGDG